MLDLNTNSHLKYITLGIYFVFKQKFSLHLLWTHSYIKQHFVWILLLIFFLILFPFLFVDEKGASLLIISWYMYFLLNIQSETSVKGRCNIWTYGQFFSHHFVTKKNQRSQQGIIACILYVSLVTQSESIFISLK